MKKDPYNHKQVFENWLVSIGGHQGIDGLGKINSNLFISFIRDFRLGMNVSSQSKKGERSYIRLNNYRHKLGLILRLSEKRGIIDITKTKPENLHNLFNDIREGKIKTRKGTAYKSTGDYVKAFKAFWHWHQKVMRKKGKTVEDITVDLDTRGEKPKFVYFTKEDFEKIIDRASFDLKPIIALAFDTGARVTELMNITISDFSNEFKELYLREEASKTFGRKIKLMLSSDQIRDYVKKLELKQEDYICRKTPPMINKELRSLGKGLLTPEQIKFKNLTLYDFRHSSACFWLPRYKSESALKYRFGWKKSDMIHYYTEFLGMKDTISEDDMYVDLTKTELEKQVTDLKRQNSEIWGLIKKLALITKITCETAIQDKKVQAKLKAKIKEMIPKGDIIHPLNEFKGQESI